MVLKHHPDKVQGGAAATNGGVRGPVPVRWTGARRSRARTARRRHRRDVQGLTEAFELLSPACSVWLTPCAHAMAAPTLVTLPLAQKRPPSRVRAHRSILYRRDFDSLDDTVTRSRPGHDRTRAAISLTCWAVFGARAGQAAQLPAARGSDDRL